MPYHISPKTGRANLCRAKKACPFGDVPHFKTKDDAEAHLQKTLEATYSTFKTTTKSSSEVVSEVIAAAQAREDLGTGWRSSWDLLHDVIPGDFTVEREIEEPDYYDTILIKKDGEYYSARTHGYGWDADYRLMSFSKVEPIRVKQEITGVKNVETTVFPPLAEIISQGKTSSLYYKNDGEPGWKITAGYASSSRYDREDGTSIIIEPLKPAGNQTLNDEPLFVNIPLDFEENGERQNARQMDEGLLIYDTRENRGVVLKWRGGSEIGESSSEFLFDGKRLRSEEYRSAWYSMGPGEIFEIEGTGKFQDAVYFKKA